MTSTTPLAWSSGRQTYHYRSVFPSHDRGMQATLHRRVPRQRQMRPTVPDPALSILAGRKIINRQQLPANLPKCYRPFLTRLETDPDELKGDATYRDLPTFRSLPILPEPRFTSADVKKITARLTTPRQPREQETPRSSRRAYTEPEIERVVKRLSEYDAKKHPAESKGTAPECESLTSRTDGGRKVSEGELSKIVERLHNFDPAKWPPESKTAPDYEEY